MAIETAEEVAAVNITVKAAGKKKKQNDIHTKKAANRKVVSAKRVAILKRKLEATAAAAKKDAKD